MVLNLIPFKCPICKGTGKFDISSNITNTEFNMSSNITNTEEDCYACGGTGVRWKKLIFKWKKSRKKVS